MNIKDILAKLLKGEALTDDEKAFAEKYDLQAELDKASAAARRKAEQALKDAEKGKTDLQAKIDELTEKLNEKEQAGKTGEAELAKLAKKIAALEKRNAENEAAIAATERSNTIRQMAKEAGITPAEGVSEKALEALIHLAVGETDIEDADAMKTVFDSFKAENPSMIAASVKGGAKVKGKPDDNAFAGVANPWKSDSFNLTKQIEISTKNPELASKMKSEAGVADTSTADS